MSARRRMKPVRYRKPYKRKAGGGKYWLRGGASVPRGGYAPLSQHGPMPNIGAAIFGMLMGRGNK